MHQTNPEKPSLFTEARELILMYLESHPGSRPSKESLTRLMLGQHDMPEGDFDDYFWYQHCAHEACSQAIGKVIRETDLKLQAGEVPQQSIPGLEGYEKVQAWYSIRDGETQRVVHALALTDKEIDEKDGELSRMQDGLSQHRRELQRLKDDPRRLPPPVD